MNSGPVLHAMVVYDVLCFTSGGVLGTHNPHCLESLDPVHPPPEQPSISRCPTADSALPPPQYRIPHVGPDLR